ncbi:MAG: carbamoyl-phosphate synthase domain-containing protein, partial [Halanaeroarchaeum sp.]
MTDAYIALETGEVVTARSRSPGEAYGELVFTTPYTGYEESLTDPSYEAQVLTFAYPLIGNYGVRTDRFESDRVHPSAVVARELTEEVAEWLQEEGVPAIDQIDTRDLVLDIRERGAMKCGIAAGPDATPEDARAQLEQCPHMSEIEDIGDRVSVDEPELYPSGADDPITTALIDCGSKKSIIDSLNERGADVHVLPHDATEEDVEAIDPDLLFVSNGPGDPANFDATEDLVVESIDELPIAGIC